MKTLHPLVLRIALICLCVIGCGGRTPLPPPSEPLSRHRALPPAPPATSPPRALALPQVTSFNLPSGVEVHVVVRNEMQMGEVALLATGGALGDSRRVEDDVVLVELLQRELVSYTSIDERGLFIHTPEASSATISHAIALLRFAHERTFQARDVLRVVRARTEERITRRSRFANNVESDLMRRFYGVSARTTWSNPMRRLEVVTTEAVNARLRQLVRPSHLTLVLVGMYDPAHVQAALTLATADWPAAAHAPPRPLTAPTFPPAIPQAIGYGAPLEMGHISMMEAGPGSFTADHAAYRIAVRLLGGMYSSRPNAILREERRESYGAHSAVSEEAGYATFRFHVSVRQDQLGAALSLLTEELSRLGREEALSDDEVERARRLELAAEMHRFDGASAIARAILNARAEGRTLEAYAERFDALLGVRRLDVARVARTWIRPRRAPIVVMGEDSWIATHDLSAPGGYERSR